MTTTDFRGAVKMTKARRWPAALAAGVEWLIPVHMFGLIPPEAGLLREVQWLKVGGLSGGNLRSDTPAISRWWGRYNCFSHDWHILSGPISRQCWNSSADEKIFGGGHSNR